MKVPSSLSYSSSFIYSEVIFCSRSSSWISQRSFFFLSKFFGTFSLSKTDGVTYFCSSAVASSNFSFSFSFSSSSNFFRSSYIFKTSKMSLWTFFFSSADKSLKYINSSSVRFSNFDYTGSTLYSYFCLVISFNLGGSTTARSSSLFSSS